LQSIYESTVHALKLFETKIATIVVFGLVGLFAIDVFTSFQNVSAVGNNSLNRPYVGIIGLSLTPDMSKKLGLNQTNGFLVTSITKRSPAEKSDLHAGTFTKTYNGIIDFICEFTSKKDIGLYAQKHNINFDLTNEVIDTAENFKNEYLAKEQ
jgi:hypothetical protein